MSDVASIVVNQAIQSAQSNLANDVGISVLKKAENTETQVVSEILNSLPVNTYNGNGQILSSGSGANFDAFA
jgi:hypothetical protein